MVPVWFFNFLRIGKPVAVAVLPKKGKKPDRTGLLNTICVVQDSVDLANQNFIGGNVSKFVCWKCKGRGGARGWRHSCSQYFKLVLKESNRGQRISIISFSFFRASFISSRLSRIFICEADVRVHDVIKGRCQWRENSPVPMIHMILSEIDYFLHLV